MELCPFGKVLCAGFYVYTVHTDVRLANRVWIA